MKATRRNRRVLRLEHHSSDGPRNSNLRMNLIGGNYQKGMGKLLPPKLINESEASSYINLESVKNLPSLSPNLSNINVQSKRDSIKIPPEETLKQKSFSKQSKFKICKPKPKPAMLEAPSQTAMTSYKFSRNTEKSPLKEASSVNDISVEQNKTGEMTVNKNEEDLTTENNKLIEQLMSRKRQYSCTSELNNQFKFKLLQEKK